MLPKVSKHFNFTYKINLKKLRLKDQMPLHIAKQMLKKQFVNCLCGSILRDNPVRLSLDTTYRLGASVARLLANSISCYENLVSSAGHDTAIHVWQLADTRPGDTTARIMPSHDLHLSFH